MIAAPSGRRWEGSLQINFRETGKGIQSVEAECNSSTVALRATENDENGTRTLEYNWSTL
jgi:hypothetical protein